MSIKEMYTTKSPAAVRGVFLILFWTVALPSLYHFSSGLTDRCPRFGNEEPLVERTSDAEFGAFAAAYYNPEHSYRPEYAIRFDRLHLSNRPIGLLRSSLQRSVHFNNLKLTLFSYLDESTEPCIENDLRLDFYEHSDTLIHPNGMNAFMFGHLDKMIHSSTRANIRVPDISKATQVEIDDFFLKWYREPHNTLSIQSRRAVFVAEKPDRIQLLGRVILTTPTGKVEANRMTWHTQKHFFQVTGRYFVSSTDTKRSGSDVALDYGLNILDNVGLGTEITNGGSLWTASTLFED